jgi:adenylate cyclase
VAKEIERKFLVSDSDWKGSNPIYICQGYLHRDDIKTVRVRVFDNTGLITIKANLDGASRDEFEYEIPVNDAKALLALCEKPLIEKYRRKIVHDEMLWEIDEFIGDNKGLIIAEIELESEIQSFSKPEWIGIEVTYDQRYYNSNLVALPFTKWPNN